jgi:hypothetical protein
MQRLINSSKNSKTTQINCLFLWLCFALYACKGNSVDDPNILNGRWVESTGRGDTLVFNNNTSFVEAKRGFEIKNGVRLPRIGSGLWEYKLLTNYQMEVRYSLSSNSATTKAHVELKEGNLYVANFYELETPNKYELRVFDKR